MDDELNEKGRQRRGFLFGLGASTFVPHLAKAASISAEATAIPQVIAETTSMEMTYHNPLIRFLAHYDFLMSDIAYDKESLALLKSFSPIPEESMRRIADSITRRLSSDVHRHNLARYAKELANTDLSRAEIGELLDRPMYINALDPGQPITCTANNTFETLQGLTKPQRIDLCSHLAESSVEEIEGFVEIDLGNRQLIFDELESLGRAHPDISKLIAEQEEMAEARAARLDNGKEASTEIAAEEEASIAPGNRITQALLAQTPTDEKSISVATETPAALCDETADNQNIAADEESLAEPDLPQQETGKPNDAKSFQERIAGSSAIIGRASPSQAP